jgi:hypothetical protein
VPRTCTVCTHPDRAAIDKALVAGEPCRGRLPVDIARTLRPYTIHAQQVMAQARADVERVPAVLMLVQRALDHAGLAETFRLLPDLDVESAARGAKSYSGTSAQHHALWAGIMASMISMKPMEAQRYLDAAEVSAALALAAPIAEPKQK